MSRFSVKGVPWGMPGAVDVSDCLTAEEVIEKAHLDFNVDKCEMVAKMPVSINDLDNIKLDLENGVAFIKDSNVYRDCPNAYSTYRTDKNFPLGMVKSKYNIVQNIDAFKFFNDAIGENKAIWQTAGAFGHGERIFVSAKLPDDITVKGDKVDNYLVFTNTHDGSSGVTILFTPIRIVCKNTLNAALTSSECFIKFRHTNSIHSKLDNAADMLGICKRKVENTEVLYNKLSEVNVTDEEVKKYIAKCYLTDEELARVELVDKRNGIHRLFKREYVMMEDANVSTRKVNMLAQTMDYYVSGPGQGMIAGTAWGAYNAITGFYSNIANYESYKRMDSMLYGNTSNVTRKSLAIAYDLVA